VAEFVAEADGEAFESVADEGGDAGAGAEPASAGDPTEADDGQVTMEDYL
jgi:hypothetical protein